MEETFHWADYVIFISFLAFSFGIGVYHSLTGGKQRTTAEFILDNRKLRIIPTILSIMMSFMSAIMIVGYSSEVYNYGSMQILWNFPGYIIGAIVIHTLILPVMFPLKLVSIYSYLEGRFQSNAIRLMGVAVGVLHAILYNGIAMYAPSVALEAVTGLSVYVSLPILAFTGTAYTALGGMRAVIWTDVFQAVVMLAGILTILIKGIILTGGVKAVFTHMWNHGRIILTQVSPDPRVRHTVWNLIGNKLVGVVFVTGVCQASVQRYSATGSLRDATMTVWGTCLLSIVLQLLACLTGIAAFAYYAMIRCDPLASGQINSPNKILAVFVKAIFKDNHGFSGFFIATLYSGALSSFSSNLSGCAAIIWEDMIKWKFGTALSERRAVYINKALIVLIGILSLAVAIIANLVPGTLAKVASSVFGACGGPMIGLFMLGILFRWINYVGAVVGVIVGLAFTFVIAFGSFTVPPFTKRLPPAPTDGCLFTNNETDLYSPVNNDNGTHGIGHSSSLINPLYQISFNNIGAFGFVVTMLVGTIVSLITNFMLPKSVKVNMKVSPKYHFNWSPLNVCRDSSVLKQDEEDIPEKENLNQEQKMDEVI